MRYMALLAIVALICGCSEKSVTTAVEHTATPAGTAQAAGTAEVTHATFNADGSPTVELSVPGMKCLHGCAPKVREVLAEQPGVRDVKVVYENKTAIVAVDKDVFDAAAAIAVLEDDAGFENTSLKTTHSDEKQPGDAPDPSPVKSHTG